MGNLSILRDTYVLGVGAKGLGRHAEYTIAGRVCCNIEADAFDRAGEIHSQDLVFGSEQPLRHANEERMRLQHATVSPTDRRGPDLDEDLTCFGNRFRDITNLNDVR